MRTSTLRTLRFWPNSPETHNGIGTALARAGRLEEAIGHFKQALRLKSDFPDARHHLEIALGMKQKTAEHGEALAPMDKGSVP